MKQYQIVNKGNGQIICIEKESGKTWHRPIDNIGENFEIKKRDIDLAIGEKDLLNLLVCEGWGIEEV